jgi:hypothetical protein
MALFKKKEKVPAPTEDCPVCGDALMPDHCTESHTRQLPNGEFIFVCICGVSTRKWGKQFGAGESMEMHLDRDHGTHVSNALDLGMLDELHRSAFPDGRATQPEE